MLVIWLVTHFARVSLYKTGSLFNFGPNSEEVTKEFYNEYIKTLSSHTPKDKDLALENLFCIKMMQYICSLNNYRFLFVTADPFDGELLRMVENPYTLENNDLNKHFRLPNSILAVEPKYKTFCHHPNEEGYTIIAEKFFNVTRSEYPELVNKNLPREFSMEYLGEPKKW